MWNGFLDEYRSKLKNWVTDWEGLHCVCALWLGYDSTAASSAIAVITFNRYLSRRHSHCPSRNFRRFYVCMLLLDTNAEMHAASLNRLFYSPAIMSMMMELSWLTWFGCLTWCVTEKKVAICASGRDVYLESCRQSRVLSLVLSGSTYISGNMYSFVWFSLLL